MSNVSEFGMDALRKGHGTCQPNQPRFSHKNWYRKPEGGQPNIANWLRSKAYDSFLRFELAWTNDLQNREKELEGGLAHFRYLIERAGRDQTSGK